MSLHVCTHTFQPPRTKPCVSLSYTCVYCWNCLPLWAIHVRIVTHITRMTSHIWFQAMWIVTANARHELICVANARHELICVTIHTALMTSDIWQHVRIVTHITYMWNHKWVRDGLKSQMSSWRAHTCVNYYTYQTYDGLECHSHMMCVTIHTCIAHPHETYDILSRHCTGTLQIMRIPLHICTHTFPLHICTHTVHTPRTISLHICTHTYTYILCTHTFHMYTYRIPLHICTHTFPRTQPCVSLGFTCVYCWICLLLWAIHLWIVTSA